MCEAQTSGLFARQGAHRDGDGVASVNLGVHGGVQLAEVRQRRRAHPHDEVLRSLQRGRDVAAALCGAAQQARGLDKLVLSQFKKGDQLH